MYGEDEEAVIGTGEQGVGGQSGTGAGMGMEEEGGGYTLRNYRDKVRAEDRRWEMQHKKLDEEFAELAYAVQAGYPNCRRSTSKFSQLP